MYMDTQLYSLIGTCALFHIFLVESVSQMRPVPHVLGSQMFLKSWFFGEPNVFGEPVNKTFGSPSKIWGSQATTWAWLISPSLKCKIIQIYATWVTPDDAIHWTKFCSPKKVACFLKELDFFTSAKLGSPHAENAEKSRVLCCFCSKNNQIPSWTPSSSFFVWRFRSLRLKLLPLFLWAYGVPIPWPNSHHTITFWITKNDGQKKWAGRNASRKFPKSTPKTIQDSFHVKNHQSSKTKSLEVFRNQQLCFIFVNFEPNLRDFASCNFFSRRPCRAITSSSASRGGSVAKNYDSREWDKDKDSYEPCYPCSKPFHHLNAISRPYAFTLRNPYATTTGAYAGDYGQHNLTRRLRDGASCRKMTPDCSASLRIPMSQGRYIQMCFFCPGICLKASLVTGFGVRGWRSCRRRCWRRFCSHGEKGWKVGGISVVQSNGLPWLPWLTRSLRTAYACLTQKITNRIHFTKTLVSFFFSSCHYWMLFPHAASCTRKNRNSWNRINSHKAYAAYANTHTLNFCLRILTRLKVLLTQPFDMSNPLCKQSTEVLNAANMNTKIKKNTTQMIK